MPLSKLDLIIHRAQRNYEANTDPHVKSEWAYVRDTLQQYQVDNAEPWWLPIVERWVQIIGICFLSGAYVFKSGIRATDKTYSSAIRSAIEHYTTIITQLTDSTKVKRRFDTKTLKSYEVDVER